ncbi:DUF4386 domain-containing protein [Brevundimonas sp. VNH65]|uniref:DUF4386 domain-containing protein n=1 Tax=Brevundimonas sp. VNH65 TaxID=3400917 RepID=UPI003C09DA62
MTDTSLLQSRAADRLWRRQALLAGALYLYIVVAGVVSEAFVRGALIDYQDAAGTARAILGQTMLYRAGFSLEMVMHLCDLGLAVLLYRLLKPQGPALSLFAAVLRLMVGAVAAVRALLLAAPLVLLDAPNGMDALSGPQREALALLALRMHGQAYDIALVFFGVALLALAVLLARSPRFSPLLGAMIGFAGVCYLLNSFAGFLAPPLQSAMFPFILLPCLVAETVLAIWLVALGVRRSDP